MTRSIASRLLPACLLVVALTATVLAVDPPPEGPLTWREIPSQRYHPIRPRLSWMNVQMDILVNGRPLPVIHHGGRSYLAVPHHGLPYQIRVRNHGVRRITAIVSVDGLSVITREPASVQDPGYLVSRGEEIIIRGFRRDRNTEAQFRFEERSRSYAAQIGQDRNIGVIGLIAIEEWSRPVLRMEDRMKGPPGAMKAEVGGTGTEAGPDLYSPSERVPFVRGTNRREITLFYATVAELRRAGIPVDPPFPVPFPRDR